MRIAFGISLVAWVVFSLVMAGSYVVQGEWSGSIISGMSAVIGIAIGVAGTYGHYRTVGLQK